MLKKLFRIERRVATTAAGSFLVDPVSVLGHALLTEGSYEPNMETLLRAELEPGMVFVDLGANEGYFSVLAAKLVGEEGRVLAVEPQTRLRHVLDANLDLNRCQNVDVVQVLVGLQDGWGRLHLAPSVNSGASGVKQRATRYPGRRERVRVKTLGQLLSAEAIEFCDLLKVDVEGAEADVIFGAEELFRGHRVRALALEYHPDLLERRGVSEQEVHRLLVDCGYCPKHSQPTLYSLDVHTTRRAPP